MAARVVIDGLEQPALVTADTVIRRGLRAEDSWHEVRLIWDSDAVPPECIVGARVLGSSTYVSVGCRLGSLVEVYDGDEVVVSGIVWRLRTRHRGPIYEVIAHVEPALMRTLRSVGRPAYYRQATVRDIVRDQLLALDPEADVSHIVAGPVVYDYEVRRPLVDVLDDLCDRYGLEWEATPSGILRVMDMATSGVSQYAIAPWSVAPLVQTCEAEIDATQAVTTVVVRQRDIQRAQGATYSSSDARLLSGQSTTSYPPPCGSSSTPSGSATVRVSGQSTETYSQASSTPSSVTRYYGSGHVWPPSTSPSDSSQIVEASRVLIGTQWWFYYSWYTAQLTLPTKPAGSTLIRTWLTISVSVSSNDPSRTQDTISITCSTGDSAVIPLATGTYTVGLDATDGQTITITVNPQPVWSSSTDSQVSATCSITGYIEYTTATLTYTATQLVLKFDLSSYSVPSGYELTGAELRLSCSRYGSPGGALCIQRVTWDTSTPCTMWVQSRPSTYVPWDAIPTTTGPVSVTIPIQWISAGVLGISISLWPATTPVLGDDSRVTVSTSAQLVLTYLEPPGVSAVAVDPDLRAALGERKVVVTDPAIATPAAAQERASAELSRRGRVMVRMVVAVDQRYWLPGDWVYVDMPELGVVGQTLVVRSMEYTIGGIYRYELGTYVVPIHRRL